MSNILFTLMNSLVAMLSNAINFEVSPTTTTAATSLNSTTMVVTTTTTAATTSTAATTTASGTNTAATTTTTAATTPAVTTYEVTTTTVTASVAPTTAASIVAMSLDCTSVGATITPVTMYASYLDISTITSNLSSLSLSSVTLSQLSRDFFSNRTVRLLQGAVDITSWELAPESTANCILMICDLFGDITGLANTQVAWLLNFMERNLDWKKLKYMRYNDFLWAFNNSGRVREIIKQHHSARHRKTQATKKLGDLWRYHPKIQGILNHANRTENWMRFTTIANQMSSDSEWANWCLNHAYINLLTRLNWKSQ